MKAKYNNIYILCPKKYASGGPEALHQLSYYMMKSGLKNVYMVYTNLNNGEDGKNPRYDKYETKSISISEIEDLESNLIIIPENLKRYSVLWKKITINIWWLSVDNYKEKSRKFDFKMFLKSIFKLQLKKSIDYLKLIFKIEKRVFDNYAASFYAYDFLKKNNKKVNELIEPISLEFLEKYKCHKYNSERKNVVLYNPKKGYEITRIIISNMPDIKFIALSGYNIDELIALYETSKVYIDFGEFPGPERIPKEAVLYGCNIITGRRGAANFYEDVMISDKYKFDYTSDKIDEICKEIYELIENYELYYRDFDLYRNKVLNLEDNFKAKILSYFWE